MRPAVVFLLAVIAAGCSSGGSGSTSASAPKSALKSALSLEGPGGTVALGDSIETAKKAFPSPPGAQVFETAMNFAILAQTGWSWATEKPIEGFEAATKDGKVIAMARTGGDIAGEPAKMIAAIGEPTRKASGKTVEVYVWEAGDKARIWVHFITPQALIPVGSMLMIGAKSDLALLNYRADDPETFVKQMDGASAQMNSPEMRKVFEDAKKRALEKKRTGS